MGEARTRTQDLVLGSLENHPVERLVSLRVRIVLVPLRVRRDPAAAATASTAAGGAAAAAAGGAATGTGGLLFPDADVAGGCHSMLCTARPMVQFMT